MHRPAVEVMQHMLAGENLALCIGRQGHVVGAGEWNLIYRAVLTKHRGLQSVSIAVET